MRRIVDATGLVDVSSIILLRGDYSTAEKVFGLDDFTGTSDSASESFAIQGFQRDLFTARTRSLPFDSFDAMDSFLSKAKQVQSKRKMGFEGASDMGGCLDVSDILISANFSSYSLSAVAEPFA